MQIAKDMDNSDSDDRASNTSASSSGYNVPSTAFPNQRDLRIQAAVRNAAATAAAVSNNTDDEQKKQGQPHAAADPKGRRPDLAPLDTKSSPYVGRESAQTASKNASDAIFAQLEVIQSLQDEITREHAKLEALHDDDIHTPPATSPSGKDSLGSPTSPTKSPTSKSEDARSGGAKPKPERHKHGQQGSSNERSAAHAYDELAAGFQERAKGVDAIMEKMSRLSQAVKEFHSLPPPVLFPDSRMLGTGDVVDTPIAMSPAVHQRRP